MHPTAIIPITLIASLCAACGSTNSSQAPSSAASVPAVASPDGTSPSSSAAASVVASDLTCLDFDFAAPRLTTEIKHVGGFVGYTGDGADVQVNLDEANHQMAILTAKAPDCAPKGVEALAALAAATDVLLVTFKTGDDPAVVAADKAALNDVRSKGIAAWKVMKINPAGWENVFPNAE